MQSELEQHYHRIEMPKIRQKIQEFKQEIGAYGKCLRLIYLYERLFELEGEYQDRLRRYERSVKTNGLYLERALIADYLPELERQIKRIKGEINSIVKGEKESSNKVTSDMIEQARTYPIQNLIDVKRGKAICPFHEDRNPSLGIKYNRYFCFSCGAKGDVIDLLMNRDGLNFIEAVKALQ